MLVGTRKHRRVLPHNGSVERTGQDQAVKLVDKRRKARQIQYALAIGRQEHLKTACPVKSLVCVSKHQLIIRRRQMLPQELRRRHGNGGLGREVTI